MITATSRTLRMAEIEQGYIRSDAVADARRAQQAELARLRDALADAHALIAAQQTRIEELSCEVLSLKGAVLA